MATQISYLNWTIKLSVGWFLRRLWPISDLEAAATSDSECGAEGPGATL